ncbi:MAG: ATP-binding protein [Clostridia bacterium]|nr:ATP-binding protein [Clostridia bacterium]
MIRKLIRSMLTAQIFSALTVSLCLLIDNIIIGRFLGVGGMAAYQLSNPLLLIIGAVGSLLAAGIQVSCSRSLGQGAHEETNAGYSSGAALAGGFSLTLTAVVLLLQGPLTTALGAGTSGELYEQTRGYISGFILGAPAVMGALVMVPFMQLAGQSALLVAAVLTMTAADVALDLLNVLVFHGGMFGIGVASAVSYYLAFFIACGYFLSRRCVFRFSRRLVTRAKILELIRAGAPTVVGMAASVILSLSLNKLLMDVSGADAVAAFGVIGSLGGAANCITTGIGGVSLTLSGVFFNEEDRASLRETLRVLARCGVVLGLLVGALLLVASPALVGLFIREDGPARDMAALGLRLFAAGLIPCCINGALKNAYQATDRVRLMEVFSLMEGAVLPVLSALVFSRFLGATGVWLQFAAGETLTLLLCGLYIRRKTGRLPWQDGAALLLKEDFGVPEGDLLERDISDLTQVTETAQAAERFCLDHGQSPRTASHIALCVEEMASNTVVHGFGVDRKPHHLSVRVLKKPDRWVLRFRDDCSFFDPVHHLPADGEDAIGLKLVRGLAEDAQYTYSLNLNNLMLKLPAANADSPANTLKQREE